MPTVNIGCTLHWLVAQVQIQIKTLRRGRDKEEYLQHNSGGQHNTELHLERHACLNCVRRLLFPHCRMPTCVNSCLINY